MDQQERSKIDEYQVSKNKFCPTLEQHIDDALAAMSAGLKQVSSTIEFCEVMAHIAIQCERLLTQTVASSLLPDMMHQAPAMEMNEKAEKLIKKLTDGVMHNLFTLYGEADKVTKKYKLPTK